MGCHPRQISEKGGARSRIARTVRRDSVIRIVTTVKRAKKRSSGGAKRRRNRKRR